MDASPAIITDDEITGRGCAAGKMQFRNASRGEAAGTRAAGYAF